jgi:arabinofuranosyltransferase
VDERAQGPVVTVGGGVDDAAAPPAASPDLAELSVRNDPSDRRQQKMTGRPTDYEAERDHLSSRGTLVAILICYGAAFLLSISLQSYVHRSERIFVLHDDAMISMRYARNLAHGLGLVWNAGERVEGMTNLLWTLWMSVPHLLGFEPSSASLWVQLSGLLLNLGTLVLVWTASDRRGARRAASIATLLLASSLPFTYWAVAGFEAPALAFLVTASVFLWLGWIGPAARAARGGPEAKPYAIGPLALLGLAYAVRPDVALIFAFVCALCAWRFVRQPAARGAILVDFLVGLLPMAALHLFRWHYYGELWPNTYYLKLTASASNDALYYLLRMAPDSLYPLLAITVFHAWRHRRRLHGWLLLTGVPPLLICYVIYSGGDVFGFARYFVPIIPLAATVTGLAFAEWIEIHPRRLNHAHRWTMAHIILCALLVAAAVKGKNFVVNLYRNRWANQDQLHLAERLKPDLRADDLIAVAWAGSLPYFLPDQRFLDMCGKCDRHIARTKAHHGPPVGHNKWDLDYALDRQQPSVIVEGGYIDYAAHPTFQARYRQQATVVVGNREIRRYWRRR